jgi:hypothetical protein
LAGYLAYTVEVDWLAVNSGTATLTVFQQIVHSELTPVAIYGAFLLVAVLTGFARRSHSRAA